MSVGFQTRSLKEVRSGQLRAFADMQLPSGTIMNGVAVCVGPHWWYAMPPSKPQVGRDGVALKNGSGKTLYVPVIEFTSKQIARRFSDAVIAALRISNPELFAPEIRSANYVDNN